MYFAINLTNLMHNFRLKTAWLNEKMSPEILENDDDITENALTMIETMEANLKQNTRNDQTSTIKHSIHSMDVDRVRYVLTSYVRHGYFWRYHTILWKPVLETRLLL